MCDSSGVTLKQPHNFFFSQISLLFLILQYISLNSNVLYEEIHFFLLCFMHYSQCDAPFFASLGNVLSSYFFFSITTSYHIQTPHITAFTNIQLVLLCCCFQSHTFFSLFSIVLLLLAMPSICDTQTHTATHFQITR